MAQVIVAPRTRDLDEMAASLRSWLEQRLAPGKGLSLQNLTYPSGAGRSHETILFDAVWTDGGEARSEGLVVRIKPLANMVYPDDLFLEQYHLMKVLHEGGWVKVAEPLWLEEDAGILGAPFFVMRKVIGRVAVSYPPYAQSGWVAEATPAQRRRFWEQGVRALASVQTVPLDRLGFLARPAGAAPGLEQEWNKYVNFIEWISADHRWPVLDAARDLLASRWPQNRPDGLVWGDARLGNLMYDDNFDVAAVVDWEQPSLGGALCDLAWWLTIGEGMHGAASGRPPLEGIGTREETIAFWEDLTGISAADIEWYEDFTALRTGCLAVSTSRVWGVPAPDHAQLAKRLGIAMPGAN